MRPKPLFLAPAAVLLTAFALWIQTPAPDFQVGGGTTPASPPNTDATERRTEPDLKGSERKVARQGEIAGRSAYASAWENNSLPAEMVAFQIWTRQYQAAPAEARAAM